MASSLVFSLAVVGSIPASDLSVRRDSESTLNSRFRLNEHSCVKNDHRATTKTTLSCCKQVSKTSLASSTVLKKLFQFISSEIVIKFFSHIWMKASGVR